MGSTTRRHRRRVTGEHTTLVARLRAGDTGAFDRLYRQHVAAMTRTSPHGWAAVTATRSTTASTTCSATPWPIRP